VINTSTPRIWLIGSAEECDIRVPGRTVSGRHCRLILSLGAYTVEDLGSTNGTFVNGYQIEKATGIIHGEPVTLGRSTVLPWAGIPGVATGSEADCRIVLMGRSPDNDIVIDHPSVSGYHARVFVKPDRMEIEDLGSTNGTGLNSPQNKIQRALLTATDVIFLGSHTVPAALFLNPPLEPGVDSAESTVAPKPAAVTDSATPVADELEPHFASVFFSDIVGFTLLNPARQVQARQQLEQCVQSSEAFQRAKRQNTVVARSTGDGMALVFFSHPLVAAECAVQISKMLREREQLAVRMGINHGTVYRLKDINGSDDVSGSGINAAQRVMDCGAAGHILISASAAETLRGTMGWPEFIHRIGQRTVKHGETIEIHNLFGPDFGNADEPAQRL
jgi:pSer/pThr/pTyr-binding forkhead associated (FHA) protein/class 3 adenylate cyclase